MYKQHVRPRDHARLPRRATEELLGDIIESVFAESAEPVLIAVGGPGGTGKSWFASRLTRRLGDAGVLRLDDYKTPRAERSRAGIFGPHPAANKMDLIAEHLANLKNNQAISKPVYNASTGDAGAEPETYRPARFNLIDGEISTYRQFRDLVDFAIFIDSDWRTQLATRLGRDLDDRDYTLDKAVATFLHSNLREFGDHGAESKNWADVHIFCHEDYRLELESVSHQLYRQTGDLLHRDVEEVELAGPIVPILTPFDDADRIDARAFVEHLDWLAGTGVRRVITGDITGELFSLTTDERLELLKLALEYFPGLVLFQAGGGPIGDAIALAKQAQSLGADAVCCLSPVGWPDAPMEGVREYFRRVGEAIEIPLIPPSGGLLDLSQHLTPEANAGSLHAPRDIASLKALVRTKINAYPAAVRPPLAQD